MPAFRNSESSPRSDAGALLGVLALLTAISAAAAAWSFTHGYTLYYGDAEAHLNIARRIFDSRTPGPEQIGTVWLPLPHVLMIPFVVRDAWWRSGLAGVIPAAACFVLAGTFLFAAARRAYGSASAALTVALLFALNPNMLYLQSTPMTEPIFAAALAALLWATIWFRDSQSWLAILAAAVASNAASLTRYEGWFLIPFVSLYLLVVARNKLLAILFVGLASLAPLAWLAHNLFYYSNALEFYNGPYSALAIQHNPYPGYHDWRTALLYYSTATRLVLGWPLAVIGIAGFAAAVWKRAWWPLAFLLLTPVFYIWSIHSSGTPITVPDLPPFGLYNTRYALAVLPLAAFAGGALIAALPNGIRLGVPILIAAVPFGAWIATRSPAITWKESEMNSIARREWTRASAGFLASHYLSGTGIAMPFGDLTGILRTSAIPLRETLHEGNGAAWTAAVIRPDLFLHEEWALAFAGDELSTALAKTKDRRRYQLRKRIMVKGAPVVEIYQR
jgi:Dolichyl-phosphate-mannose-protein mannosyltransferase